MSKSRTLPYVDYMNLHNEVTGSGNILIVNFPNKVTRKILIDYGMFQEKQYEDLNQISNETNLEDIDYVFVTHNHLDHVGKLPLLTKNGYSGKVYCTEITKKAIHISLMNTVKIISNNKNEKPIYSKQDVNALISRLTVINYNETLKLDEYVSVTLLSNSHLGGACMVFLSISYDGIQDRNYLFTGDYKHTNRFYKVPKIPGWVFNKKINAIITESTYGYQKSFEIKRNFRDDLEKLLLDDTINTIFIASISQERPLSIFRELYLLQKNNILDEDVEIFYDSPLGIKYYEDIYTKYADFVIPKNLIFLNKKTHDELVLDIQEKPYKKRIVIAASGMLDHGRARDFLKLFIEDSSKAFFITCFTPEGTLANEILNNQSSTIKIDGIIYNICAKFFSTSQFSQHDFSDDLIRFFKKFLFVDNIFINHGSNYAKQCLFEEIKKDEHFKNINVEIMSRDKFIRINSKNEIKIFNSKFNKNSNTNLKRKKQKRAKIYSLSKIYR